MAKSGFGLPILLTLMRVCQGIGLGGEWGGAVLMAVEHAPGGPPWFLRLFPADRRRWLAGLLSVFAFWMANSKLSDAQFLSWGWRLPFLFSIVLVAIGIWVPDGHRRIACLPKNQGREG